MTDEDDARLLTRRLRWGADREGAELAEVDPDTGWDAGSDEAPSARAVLTPVIAQSFEERDLDRRREEALDRRRQLWRDTAIILSGLVAALLVANTFFPLLTGIATSSPTPPGATVGAGPDGSTAPGPTSAPGVEPSLAVEATAAPHPGLTLPPTGTFTPTHPATTPRPTPRRTPTPTAPPTPMPTPQPTPQPTPVPTPEPTPVPTPEPTPVPPPTAVVSCGAPTGLTVTCTSSSIDALAGSEHWDMGGAGVLVDGGDGFASITWTYADVLGSPYTVTLQVRGLDGSSTDTDTTQVSL